MVVEDLATPIFIKQNHYLTQALTKISKKMQTLAQYNAQSYVWPDSRPEIRMQPQKGAAIT